MIGLDKAFSQIIFNGKALAKHLKLREGLNFNGKLNQICHVVKILASALVGQINQPNAHKQKSAQLIIRAHSAQLVWSALLALNVLLLLVLHALHQPVLKDQLALHLRNVKNALILLSVLPAIHVQSAQLQHAQLQRSVLIR